MKRGESKDQSKSRISAPDPRPPAPVACFFLLILLCSCGQLIRRPPAEPVLPPLKLLTANQFPPFFDDLDRVSLKRAVSQSLAALQKKSAGETLYFGDERVSVMRMRESLEVFLLMLETNSDLHAALAQSFNVYRVTTPVLFTGYYEPLLPGSLTRTERYRYPLYRRPDDLIEVEFSASSPDRGEKSYGRMVEGTLFPYFSREEIDGQGVLEGRGYELVWVDDPVARFFLHIQGSGQIQLPDGSRLRIGYAAANGQPYRSIGKILLAQGKLLPGEASALAIRRYLYAHPEEQDALFFHNPRYIFFQLAADGPRGSLGVPLTPGRSLAVDPKIYPSGTLGFIHTRRPVGDGQGQIAWQEFSRFVLLQDSGAAITGWGRADLFWGSDEKGEAGYMAQGGEMYLLLKKSSH